MALGNQIRWLRCAGCVAGLGCLAMVCSGAGRMHAVADTPSPAKTHAVKKIVALSPWEQAEQGREALEAIPEDTRTRADYTRAMDAYRTIYHANPADGHAPSAVYSVAELLAEQGRSLHDPKSLQAAVGQYEFLRKQYPGSSLRVQALLAEGQIEEDDLGDAKAAREKYKLLLKEHPKSEQAEEARAGLDSLDQAEGAGYRVAGRAAAGTHVSDARRAPESVVAPAISSLPSMTQTGEAELTHHDGIAMNEAPGPVTPPPAGGDVISVAASGGRKSGKRAVVSGIRHWSTATYTRVAIDLGDSVTYEAARVPNPDRIYFDLHGSRLAQELVGKSFAVTDDGFLKKVRAAQYSDDVTRVVLDVNDVTEYSAFLLPNPYRLIIDIHGGPGTANKGRMTASAPMPPDMDVPAPRVAMTVKPTAARPVPNTVATKNTSATTEVADLSDMPGKVEATRKPTSKPISAVVEDETPSVVGAVETHVPEAGHGAPDSVAVQSAKDGTPSAVATNSASSSKKTRRGKKAAADSMADATPARAATPMADGETSLVRALGLKIGRIVIDAGHGGHDSGTLGADGIQEKDVVLDVALRLGKLLHDRLGAEIIYTRSDDTFIPLETRTAIANKAQADLFLSIHANSSSDASARGVETYYLNFTSDPTALDVAARENAVSDQSIHQLSDLVKKIALKDKIAESREFASDVEDSLYSGLQKGNAGLKDRGVKKAPFVVLIGANMPSILAEISFVTNPKDAAQLQEPEYRQRVAESIYKGVARYEGGLSATRVTTERASVGQ
jgi:N-acetylmuramoyl-L-alanine amidase